jgi:hypothetical protein
MLAAGLIARTPVPVNWDGWDYAWMAMRAKPSGLCLGRWWFIFLMRLAWLGGSLLGIEPEAAYVPMQLAVALMTAAGLVLVMHWTWRLTGDRLAAISAGAVVGLSPSLLAYASGVMTEGPTMLLLAGAWLCWESSLRRTDAAGVPAGGGWALLGGICFGVAVSMREPALLLAGWPIARCLVGTERRRWTQLPLAVVGTGLSLSLAVLMAWRWSGVHPGVVLSRYAAYMRAERTIYGFSGLANVAFLMLHFVTASPLGSIALGVGLARWIRRRWVGAGNPDPATAATGEIPGTRRRLLALAISTGPYVLMTWWNPDLSFNYRLLLPLVAVLAPALGYVTAGQIRSLSARWIRWSVRTRRLVAAVGLITAGLLVFGSTKRLGYHYAAAAQQERLYAAMRKLPDSATVYPGPGSAIGLFLHRSGARPYWHVHANTPAAASWTPGSLSEAAREVLARGGQVYVNADPTGWTRATGPNPEWRAISGFLRRGRWAEAPGPFVRLETLDAESGLAPDRPGR